MRGTVDALGVETTDDLLFLEESDLTNAGLSAVAMTLFKAGVQSLRDAAAAATAATDIEQKNDQDNTDVDLAAAKTTEE